MRLGRLSAGSRGNGGFLLPGTDVKNVAENGKTAGMHILQVLPAGNAVFSAPGGQVQPDIVHGGDRHIVGFGAAAPSEGPVRLLCVQVQAVVLPKGGKVGPHRKNHGDIPPQG